MAYTYEQFKEYLINDVLQNVSSTLGWTGTVWGNTDVVLTGTNVGHSTYYTLSSGPTTHPIPKGTPITYIQKTYADNGSNPGVIEQWAYDKIVAAHDHDAGVTQIDVEMYDGVTGVKSATVSQIAITSELIRLDDSAFGVINEKVFEEITDEALFEIGSTSPETVEDDERFRLAGRVEAWRAVANATMTDVDVMISDSNLVRSRLHKFAVEQLNIAEFEYNREYPFRPPVLGGRPRAMTYAGKINVRF
jgi:hypothetical protein